MRRRVLLLLVVALAGCGSSGAKTIDAGNAKKLEAATMSPGVFASDRHATLVGGRLELRAPNARWNVSAAPKRVAFADARTGKTVDALVSPIARPAAIAWTRDSQAFAVGGKDGRVTVWEEFKHRTYDLPTGKSEVAALAFSPDARLLATAQEDGGLRIWDLDRRKEVARLGPREIVTLVRFTADDRRILALTATGALQLKLPR
jgi:hypothetical protein